MIHLPNLLFRKSSPGQCRSGSGFRTWPKGKRDEGAFETRIQGDTRERQEEAKRGKLRLITRAKQWEMRNKEACEAIASLSRLGPWSHPSAAARSHAYLRVRLFHLSAWSWHRNRHISIPGPLPRITCPQSHPNPIQTHNAFKIITPSYVPLPILLAIYAHQGFPGGVARESAWVPRRGLVPKSTRMRGKLRT